MLKGRSLPTVRGTGTNRFLFTRREAVKSGAAWAIAACVPAASAADEPSRKLAAIGQKVHTPPSTMSTVRATYVPSSAKRLSQVTGNYDPTGLTHLNDTTKWGISGTDMGCPVEFKGRLYLLFGDVPTTLPIDLDPVCYTTDRKVSSGNIRLSCVTEKGRSFKPLTVDGATMGTNETVTGAFAHNNRLYAFVVRGNSRPYSTLVSTQHPEKSLDFTSHYDVSDVHGKFWQIAPYVVKNAEWPGLPSRSGKGLLMWGQSGTSVYLAWMPLAQGIPPLEGIRYYTPTGTWSTDQSMAGPIFSTNNVTQVSASWLRGPGKWIFLYTKASVDRPHESIVARVGADPWTWSEEVILFNPDREDAWGKYMYQRGQDSLYTLPPPRSPSLPGYAYSPFLLNRYTTWNAATRYLKVIYLMATFVPYQVMLMEATLQIE